MKNYIVTIIFVVIYLLIIFLPLEGIAFMPDIFDFSKLNSQDYFGLIIGAVSSIFGIMMAVIILSVEFFKERITKNNFVNPIEFKDIQNAIYLSVIIIFLSFLSYLIIEDFKTSRNITIGYYIGVLFLLYIFSVFPFFKELVDRSSQIKGVLELANSLVVEDFEQASKYRFQKHSSELNFIKIKKSVDSYIIENKIESYETVNDKILEKTFEFIGDGADRETCDNILGALTWLWRENCKTAIRSNDSQFFNTIWDSINKIYQHFADKKIELLHIQEIHTFIYFDLKSLYKYFKNTLSLSNALDVIENSFRVNVTKNCPKQEDIWDLIIMYEKDSRIDSNFSASSTWDGIIDIVKYINDIQNIAIELGDRELFEECNLRLDGICSHIIYEYNNLGSYQKGYLVWNILTTSYYYSSIALEKGLYKDTLDCYKVYKYLVESIIEGELLGERDIRVILRNLGNNLFEALKYKKLHSDNNYGTFSDFYKIGIHSIKKYHDSDLNKNVVDYFISYLIFCKEFIENEGLDNYVQEYNCVKKAISHFINIAEDYDNFKEDENPLKEWKTILENFQEIKLETPLNFKWEIK
ncbi:hypothetical protein [Chryseobacterium sp. WLY505]|uniref:hypothetical protein n=1 Tax=Chryseobacterium sp. WLY505 TaxID=3068892 RepID=UPI0027966252|nr:hypothetical protein [Chryseobacterium sp. WLY505]MDQ1858484.1 hypothetical protein [Chryseobacterium sp. WLY505]